MPTDSTGSVVINNIMFFSNNVYYYLRYDNYDEDNKAFSIFDQNNNEILSYSKIATGNSDGSNIQYNYYYIYYYDNNGEIALPDEGESDISNYDNIQSSFANIRNQIYTSLGRTTGGYYSTSKTNLVDGSGNAYIDYNTYSNIIRQNGNYIYVDSDYIVLDSITGEDLAGNQATFYTTITRADYGWSEAPIITPTYQTLQRELTISAEDMDKIDVVVTGNTIDDTSVTMQNNNQYQYLLFQILQLKN